MTMFSLECSGDSLDSPTERVDQKEPEYSIAVFSGLLWGFPVPWPLTSPPRTVRGLTFRIHAKGRWIGHCKKSRNLDSTSR